LPVHVAKRGDYLFEIRQTLGRETLDQYPTESVVLNETSKNGHLLNLNEFDFQQMLLVELLDGLNSSTQPGKVSHAAFGIT
jgi:hypothetical protein